MTDLSIVIPAYNEQENIPRLYRALSDVLKGKKYEIIIVDDGSKDNTFKVCEEIHQKDKKLKVIKFRRNFGQTAAFDAGIKHSKSKVIITMDADLQNDPNDISLLLNKLNEGYDCISGWRFKRKDPFMKKFVSFFANIFRRLVSSEEQVHDSGCSLKAYKKECFDNLNLYGEMHRFIPSILFWKGFRVGEVKVSHHPRKYGKTKYGVMRIIKGFLDFIIVRFWMKYSVRPMHLFGTLGIISTIFGSLIGGYLSLLKLFTGISIANRPLLLLAVLLVVLGAQFLILGIIADILIKIYFEKSGNSYYSIKAILD